MWLLFGLLLIAIAFGTGTLLGAPYLPTRRRQAETALKLLKLQPGDKVLDLGSGDGSFLLTAARQGIKGIGYEINPVLVLVSKLVTWRYRMLVSIRWKNFWHTSWPTVDGIYVFLIGRYMQKLDDKLCQELTQPTPVASYAFKLPGRKVVKSQQGINLYYWQGC